MNAATQSFAFSQSLENANVRMMQNSANTHAKQNANASIKALALQALRKDKVRSVVRKLHESPCEKSCENAEIPTQVNAKNQAFQSLCKILDHEPDLWVQFYPGEPVSFSLQVHPWWNPALGEVYQLFIEAADAIEARAKEVKAHYGKRRNQ